MASFKKPLITIYLVFFFWILPAQEVVSMEFFFDQQGDVTGLRIFLSIVNPVVFAVLVLLFLNTRHQLPVVYKTTYLLAIASLFFVPLFFVFSMLDKISIFPSLCIINNLVTGILIIMALTAAILSYPHQRRKSLFVLSVFALVFVFIVLRIIDSYALTNDVVGQYATMAVFYETLLLGILMGAGYYHTLLANQKLQSKLLEKNDAELQAFSKGRIRERKQIASILHDQMSSQLLATYMLVRQDKNCLALQNLKKLGNDIRFLSHSLMPLALEQGLLIDALQQQLKLFKEAFPEKTIEFYNLGFPKKIEYPWIFEIYLIVTEAIQNAIKHSKSELIVIETYDYETIYTFQVVDNGNGFDAQSIPQGFGLTHSREVLKGYNGTFELDTTPGEGTVVMISVPK